MATAREPIEELDDAGPLVQLLVAREALDADDQAGESYFPPTDPVLIGEDIVCGFSRTSMDELVVEPSTLDGLAGDEALADAVREELRADAATSALEIDVSVEGGVAYLHGQVDGIEDVDNVEEVASRIPALAEVIEDLVLAS